VKHVNMLLQLQHELEFELQRAMLEADLSFISDVIKDLGLMSVHELERLMLHDEQLYNTVKEMFKVSIGLIFEGYEYVRGEEK